MFSPIVDCLTVIIPTIDTPTYIEIYMFPDQFIEIYTFPDLHNYATIGITVGRGKDYLYELVAEPIYVRDSCRCLCYVWDTDAFGE